MRILCMQAVRMTAAIKLILAHMPLAAYQHAINSQGFVPDAAQAGAAECLQRCHDTLLQTSDAVSGVYLWGPVGRGKTWLMDAFSRSLQASGVPVRRQHFHHFMRWVHQRLFALTGTANPLRLIAWELRAEVRVLCFDELQITDIGDAMILGGLLQALFEEGLVLVVTSNQPPEALYANGFNRERLLPALAAIAANLQVVSMDGGQDHRLHPDRGMPRYWLRGPGSGLAAAFARYQDQTGTNAAPFALGHLQLPVVARSDSAIWFRFADLCGQALAAIDFITLCDQFAAIFLSEVPNLSGQQLPGRIARGTEDGAEKVLAGDRELPALSVHDDSVRRFIALVDECYDRRIPLFIEAEVALEALYTDGYLQFPFRRTLSRLREMQLARYGVPAA